MSMTRRVYHDKMEANWREQIVDDSDARKGFKLQAKDIKALAEAIGDFVLEHPVQVEREWDGEDYVAKTWQNRTFDVQADLGGYWVAFISGEICTSAREDDCEMDDICELGITDVLVLDEDDNEIKPCNALDELAAEIMKHLNA